MHPIYRYPAHFLTQQTATTVVTDVASGKLVGDITSTEETSVEVRAALTRAHRDEGLLGVIEERRPDAWVPEIPKAT